MGEGSKDRVEKWVAGVGIWESLRRERTVGGTFLKVQLGGKQFSFGKTPSSATWKLLGAGGKEGWRWGTEIPAGNKRGVA